MPFLDVICDHCGKPSTCGWVDYAALPWTVTHAPKGAAGKVCLACFTAIRWAGEGSY